LLDLIPHFWHLIVLTSTGYENTPLTINTRSFTFPFTMVTALYCEHCNCFFPPHLLDQHQNGRRHLSNVASNSLPNFDTPQEPPPPRPGSSNAQLAPLPNTLPPSGSNTPTPAAEPRVTVSDEGGLDFLVVGTGDPKPSFSLSSHTVLITKTEVKSKIFVKSWDLAPLSNSQCELVFCDTLL
jgi:hypothetical protein